MRGCSQKTHEDPLELESLVKHPTWVLGTQLRSAGRTAGALHHGAISPVPMTIFQNKFKSHTRFH